MKKKKNVNFNIRFVKLGKKKFFFFLKVYGYEII